jgi:hypothetical protein
MVKYRSILITLAPGNKTPAYLASSSATNKKSFITLTTGIWKEQSQARIRRFRVRIDDPPKEVKILIDFFIWHFRCAEIS